MTRALLMILFVLIPISGQAQCLVPEAVPASAPMFIDAVVSALAVAKEGIEAQDLSKSNTKQTVEQAVEMLAALRRSARAFDCVGTHVAGYKVSKIETIKLGAEALVDSFQTLAMHSRLTSEMFKKYLNDPAQAERIGDFAASLEELQDIRNNSWEGVRMAVTAATFATLTPDTTGQKMISALTAAERRKARANLLEIFGPSIAQGLKTGQSQFVASGATLFEVLGQTLGKTP